MMGVQNPCQNQQGTLHKVTVCRTRDESLHILSVHAVQIGTLQKVAVLPAGVADMVAYVLQGFLKARGCLVLQGKEEDRALIHPFLAKLPVGGNLQPFKKLAAVLRDIKELGKHGQKHGLSEAVRAGIDRCVCRGPQMFFERMGLVYVMALKPGSHKKLPCKRLCGQNAPFLGL